MKNRRIIHWILIIVFIWVVVSRFADIQKLAETLSKGQWQWVVAAAFIQVIYYLAFTGLYWSSFDTVEVKSRLWNLIPVVFGSIFLNVVAPTGGASGAALFIDDASRRGQSAARATAGTFLQLIADFSSFSLVLAFGLVYLFIQHDLKSYEIIAAIILFIIILSLCGVLLLGLWRSSWLRSLLNWFKNVVNRFMGWISRKVLRSKEVSPFLEESWVENNVDEFTYAASAIGTHPFRLARTLTIALIGHILDLLTLFILFRAFGEHIKFGPLVAGYAVGVLFWIVSITPQGIGVVEGLMAVVYASLGVNGNIATVVALGFRGLTFWIPLFLGFVSLQRVKSFRAQVRSTSEVWTVRIVAILTGIMGLINILSATTPTITSRLELLRNVLPLEIRHGSHLASVLAGFALLLLAGSLWRRKRVAWVLTITMLLISIPSHLLKGLDYEEAILAGMLIVWLLFLRNEFHARSDRPSFIQGVRGLVLAFLFTLIYGVLGFYLIDRTFTQRYELFPAIQLTLVMLTQFYYPGAEPLTHFGRYFITSFYMVEAVTGGYSLLMLVRPVLVRTPATPQENQRAREIVEAYGNTSLARFTILRDKSHYFSPGGTMFAFVVKHRIALALGDPIGPPQDIDKAIEVFNEFCATNGWEPAFYQCQPDTLEVYRKHGFQAMSIGQEAIVDLKTFTLEGRSNKSLRTSMNRLVRVGYHTELHLPPLSDQLMVTLAQISDEWLTAMGGSEKRFSLGWFEDEYIRNGPVMVVVSQEGHISAFTNIIPEYKLNESSIDMMRHRREVEPGTMDFLFISLIQWARENKYDTFNLGLSSLAGVGEKRDSPAIEKALHYIYEHVNQFYNFKGLHEFKDKYNPTWSPRYLIYKNDASLPAIALAMIQADSGDDVILSMFKELLFK